MKNPAIKKTAAALLALTVWQAAAMIVGQNLILASPVQAVNRLASLALTQSFWGRVWFSFAHIAGGFAAALLAGTALGILAGRFPLLETLLRPYMLTIKSVPVVSFIIMLLWFLADSLSVVISFLMVLPVIYTNVLSGVRSVDPKLTEAADVFRIPFSRRLKYLILPAVRPYLLSGCGIGLGLAWKAGIAAEVISIASGSMGEALYEAKIYFSTSDLFAWTIAIVLLSLAFEKLAMLILRKLLGGLEGD